MDGEREELREHVRSEHLDLDRTVAVRGGRFGVDAIRRHAERTHRAYVLDSTPVYGVSVFCALDEVGRSSLDALLGGRLVTYRWLHMPEARQFVEAGFMLLPTFSRPHYTVLLDAVSDKELGRLGLVLGPSLENPYHQRGRSGRR